MKKMITRRNFLKAAGVSAAAADLTAACLCNLVPAGGRYRYRRAWQLYFFA